jgi:hypothetical protein
MTGTLPIAKLAVQVTASLGVSKVVWDVIARNTTVVTNFDAVRVLAGQVVLGTMVADAAAKHVNARMDEAIAWYESRKAEKPEEK